MGKTGETFYSVFQWNGSKNSRVCRWFGPFGAWTERHHGYFSRFEESGEPRAVVPHLKRLKLYDFDFSAQKAQDFAVLKPLFGKLTSFGVEVSEQQQPISVESNSKSNYVVDLGDECSLVELHLTEALCCNTVFKTYPTIEKLKIPVGSSKLVEFPLSWFLQFPNLKVLGVGEIFVIDWKNHICSSCSDQSQQSAE